MSRVFSERSRSPRGQKNIASAGRPFEVLSGSLLLGITQRDQKVCVPDVPVCSHFLQGRCRYGDSCMKKHLGAQEARQRALSIGQGAPMSQQQTPPGLTHAQISATSSQVQAGGIAGRMRAFELVGKQLQGVLKSFTPATGYGFVSCQETFEVFGRDVFVTGDQVKDLCPGAGVRFEVIVNEKGLPQARNVVPDALCHGYIKSFKTSNGYGFIHCAETFAIYQRDVFVHKDQIGSLEVGQEVAFTVILNDKMQPQAKNLRVETNGSLELARKNEQDALRTSASSGGLPERISATANNSDAYDPFASPPATNGPETVKDDMYDPLADTSASGNAGNNDGDRNNNCKVISDGSEAYDPFA